MNILQQRKISGFILFALVMIGCSSSESKLDIVSISKGIEVVTPNYYFSDSADISIADAKYSLRSKAEYVNKKLTTLTVYQPEGELTYDYQDLKKDPKLLSNYGYYFECNIVKRGTQLFDIDGENSAEFVKISDKIIKTKNDKLVTLYTLK